MGPCNSTRKIELTTHDNLEKFPYILNLSFTYNINKENINFKSIFEDSKFLLTIFDRSYELMSKFHNNSEINFFFSIPLLEHEFRELKSQIDISCTLYKDGQYEFYKEMNLGYFIKEKLHLVKNASPFKLQLKSDEKKMFTNLEKELNFRTQYFFTGNYLMDYLKIYPLTEAKMEDKKIFFYEFLKQDDFLMSQGKFNRDYYMSKGVNFIFDKLSLYSLNNNKNLNDEKISFYLNENFLLKY